KAASSTYWNWHVVSRPNGTMVVFSVAPVSFTLLADSLKTRGGPGVVGGPENRHVVGGRPGGGVLGAGGGAEGEPWGVGRRQGEAAERTRPAGGVEVVEEGAVIDEQVPADRIDRERRARAVVVDRRVIRAREREAL